jgi:excinuclease ABC subunit C
MDILGEKIKHLPENPGVYVMLDSDGQIIYVGKAKNLKNRVRQYFQNSVKTEKVMAMVKSIADFYYIIVPTEIDALSLENNLIKKHKPRYNILLKDDKTYPYLRVDIKEDFPTFKVVRKIKKDGAKYFGPFMGGVSVRDVLEIINLAFGIRPCDKKLNPDKPIKE